jgi:hypothetical protein
MELKTCAAVLGYSRRGIDWTPVTGGSEITTLSRFSRSTDNKKALSLVAVVAKLTPVPRGFDDAAKSANRGASRVGQAPLNTGLHLHVSMPRHELLGIQRDDPFRGSDPALRRAVLLKVN